MKHNSAINLHIVVSLLVVVSSCSGSVKGNWTCPTPEGGKGSCVSIKEADLVGESATDSENKSNFTYLDSVQKIEIKLVTPKFKDLKKLQQERGQEGGLEVAPQAESKLRTPERVGKIWFAPHIDSDGNQHSESVIYVVDEEPKWVSLGVKHD